MKKKFTVKKVFLAILGLLLTLLILIAIANTMAPRSAKQADSSSEYYDPKLEALRERNNELDLIYEGDEGDFVEVEELADGDLFSPTNQLSDFDTFKEKASSEGVQDPIPDPELIEPTGTLEAEPELGEQTSDDPFASISPKAEVSSLSDDPDRDMVTALSIEAEQSPSSAPVQTEVTQEDIRDALDVYFSQNPSILSSDDLEDLARDQTNRFNELSMELQTMTLEAQSEIRSAIDNVDFSEVQLQIGALVERLDSLEAQSQLRQQQANQPSRAQLQNLYRLKRIENQSVELVGQNTGRSFTFSEGDRIAHGGTVTKIDGGNVTLSWPSTTITLSVY